MNNYTPEKEKTSFFPCKKYICRDRKTGEIVTGIQFLSGKVKVGVDVWRLSNIADYCDYPFKSYPNLHIAELDYEFHDAPFSFKSDGETTERSKPYEYV